MERQGGTPPITPPGSDDGPAGTEPVPTSLPQRRPAEVTTFVAALVAAAALLGLDLSTEAVFAVFVLVGAVPAVVTWGVNVYKDARRNLGA